MTWSNDLTQWGVGYCLKAVCDHSESIAELGWVVSEISIKSSEGVTWCVDWWCCTTNLDAPYPFFPHYTFLFVLPYACSPHISLPVTNIASFRTIEWVQKDVPTTATSNSLLDQAVIAYLEVRIYHKILADSNENSTHVLLHMGGGSSSSCHPDLLPW